MKITHKREKSKFLFSISFPRLKNGDMKAEVRANSRWGENKGGPREIKHEWGPFKEKANKYKTLRSLWLHGSGASTRLRRCSVLKEGGCTDSPNPFSVLTPLQPHVPLQLSSLVARSNLTGFPSRGPKDSSQVRGSPDSSL